jgi:hypothetical protein
VRFVGTSYVHQLGALAEAPHQHTLARVYDARAAMAPMPVKAPVVLVVCLPHALHRFDLPFTEARIALFMLRDNICLLTANRKNPILVLVGVWCCSKPLTGETPTMTTNFVIAINDETLPRVTGSTLPEIAELLRQVAAALTNRTEGRFFGSDGFPIMFDGNQIGICRFLAAGDRFEIEPPV